jgi:hypothetical protein
MSEVIIRRADVEDTAAVVTVLRRSIAELCVEDHHNDPQVGMMSPTSRSY